MTKIDLTAIATPVSVDEIRLGYLRAALDRIAGDTEATTVTMAVAAQAALDLDDTLKVTA